MSTGQQSLTQRQQRRRRHRHRQRRVNKHEQQQHNSSSNTLAQMPPIIGAHNLAGVPFDLTTLAVLNKGLKFIPTPLRLSLPSLQQSLQRFERNVALRCQFGEGAIPLFRVPNPAFQPEAPPPAVAAFLQHVRTAATARLHAIQQQRVRTPNMVAAERLALQQLRAMSGIRIKPADKNLGLVVMQVGDYHDSVMGHLSDTTTYTDITARFASFLTTTCNTLQQLVNTYECELGDAHSKYALQGNSMQQPAYFYALPKLHKMQHMGPPIISRPIAASHSWVTTPVSQLLAHELNGELHKYDTILRDRNELITLVESTAIPTNAWLVTFDIESLYPNVAQYDCADACAMAVTGSPRHKSMVKDLMLFILQHNVVQYRDRRYLQITGGAMGTPVLPPAAQLYLAIKWEGELKQKLQAQFPTIFKRFIDDGFVVFQGTEQELLVFLQQLNTLLPNIRITFTYSQSSVDVMDTVIYKSHLYTTSGMCSLKVRTHQKVLNKYLYIPPSSHHSRNVFSSFVRAELIRYVVTNTDECWYHSMVTKFKHRLLQRGYALAFIDAAIGTVSYADRSKYLSHAQHQSAATATAAKGTAFVVPYAGGVSDMQLQQLLHSTYMAHPDVHQHISKPFVSFTKCSNLGAMLVHAKDSA